MRHRWSVVALAAFAAAFALCSPPPASAQETVRFSLAEARGLAREAYRRGDFKLANAIARQLAEKHPDDTAALLLLAATEPKLGRPAVGRRAGLGARRIFTNRSAYLRACLGLGKR